MSCSESKNLVKVILSKMNSGKFDLDQFFEALERETGGKLTFSSFKSFLDKHYDNISKNDRILLLKHISIEQTGLIDLPDLFNSFSKLIKETLYSPILAFMNIARKIENNLKFTSLEFMHKNSLNLEQELSIKEFFSYISESLHLDETTTKNVFKCLDFKQKGKILVSDFIVVIDSYRQDYMENLLLLEKKEEIKEPISENSNGNLKEDASNSIDDLEIPNKFNLNNSQINLFNKFLQIVEEVGLTSLMFFSISGSEKNAKEIYLENLKKKLKLLIPSTKINELEIAQICEAFDIHKKKYINFDDYMEVLDLCKMNPIFTSSINANFNKKSNANTITFKKDEPQLKKIRINNKNVHFLPVRGNTKVLNQIRETLYSRINPNNKVFSKNFSSLNNSSNQITEENKDELNASHEKNNKLETYNLAATPNKENKSKEQTMHKFIKELEVFENGEWFFIDVIESIKIESQTIPLFNVFNTIKEKLNPSIQKNLIFNVAKLIDYDMDGYISYLDLMNFLLNRFNHSSVKLAFKEISRVIEIDNNHISTLEFFKKFEINEFDELNSFKFMQMVSNVFKLPSLVVKKLYHDLKELSKKDRITSKFFTEMIDEYREKIYLYGADKNFEIENQNKNSKLLNLKYTNINSNVDKNLFNAEMKKLVKFLQTCFSSIKIDSYSFTKIKSSFFRDNIIKFIDLPQKLTLTHFRENFINSLDINLSLGITMYNEIKTIENFSSFSETIKNKLKESNELVNTKNNKSCNNNTTISLDNLMNLIISFYDPTITQFDIETVVNLIEKNFIPIKNCFEAAEYIPNGFAIIEAIRMFERFYKRVSRQIIIRILNVIDSERKGLLFYKNINAFLFRYSKNFKFSVDLFLKELASLIDKTKLPTFKYFQKHAEFSNIDKLNDKVYYNEHNSFFFEKLKFNFELSDYVFSYLSNVKDLNQTSIQNKDKTALNKFNSEEAGYAFEKLMKNIDYYRARIPSNKYILAKRFIKIFDNSSQINSLVGKSESLHELSVLLNKNIKLSFVLNEIYISNDLLISVFEFFQLLKNNCSKTISKESILRFLRFFDSAKKGFIAYESLYKVLKQEKSFEIENLLDLQIRFIAIKINNDFSCNFDNFLTFKNLSRITFLSYNDFKIKFINEFFKDKIMMTKIFDKLKEKKGKFENMLLALNFVDYLLYQLNYKINVINNLTLESNVLNNVENDLEKIENEDRNPLSKDSLTLNKLANLELDFINTFLENLDLKEANITGKINKQAISRTLINSFEDKLNQVDLKVFLTLFETCDKNFDLMSFIEWCELNFKLFSIDEIIRKVRESAPEGITKKDFFSNFKIYSAQLLTLFEFTSFSSVIFKLSKFESIYSFLILFNSEKNFNSIEYKCSFELFLSEFKLNEIFKAEDEPCKEDLSNIKKLDKFVIMTLGKLANFLETLKSKEELFKSYDSDSNGILNRREFEKLLLESTLYGVSLNDLQITSIINLADTNGDGVINYAEFIDFLDFVQSSYSNKYQKSLNFLNVKEEEKIYLKSLIKDYSDISAVKNITILYDLEALKDNYEFNLRNFSSFQLRKINSQRITVEKGKFVLKDYEVDKVPIFFNLVLYHLQEEFALNLNKFLYEMSTIDNNLMNILPYDLVIEFLLKREKLKTYLNDIIKKKLLDFAYEGLTLKQTKNLSLKKSINLKQFVSNIINFRVEVIEESYIELDDETQNEILKKAILNSFATKKKTFNNKLFEKDIINYLTDFSNNKLQLVDEIKNKKLPEAITNKANSRDKALENNIKKYYDFLSKFKSVMDKLAISEFDYKINPETDYFKRPNGQIVETILNNEEAAIKKCELIFNSLKNSELFFDTEFGSQPNDNGLLHKLSLYKKGVKTQNAFETSEIAWFRIEEISAKKDPIFISDSKDSNSIAQGHLGNRWFTSALAILASKDHLLIGEIKEEILDEGIIDQEQSELLSTGVYPPVFHSFRIKNIYCFKFYKDFCWRWVVIDDRLPCRKPEKNDDNKNQTPKLIYSRSKSENEFWVSLIEKAYAKLHGCYEALGSGGFIDEALVDLTGFSSRKINLKFNSFTQLKADDLWSTLKEYFSNENSKKRSSFRSNNFAMGASIDVKTNELDVIYKNKKCGLLARYAYPIIDVFEIPKPTGYKPRKKSRLLRIVNPWGPKEWKGKWSKYSAEILKNKQIIKQVLKEKHEYTNEDIDLNNNNETFLMSFKDFRFHDAWTSSESGGLPLDNIEKDKKAFAKNPQYYIKIKEATTIQITLLQTDGRTRSENFPYTDHFIKSCLVLTPVKSKQSLESFENNNEVEITLVNSYRENTIIKNLKPGQYVLSACCLYEGISGYFCLQFNFEDRFIDCNVNKMKILSKLKNVYIERLNDFDQRVKYELIQQGNYEEIKAKSNKKCEFLFNNFGKMIKHNDEKLFRVLNTKEINSKNY